MTTEEKFFEKIFLEGDKAKPIYKDYKFEILSDKEKQFLRNLSIFSKYKDWLKYFIFKRKVKTRDQVSYIETYKQQLDYKNYIEYEQMKGYQIEMRQLSWHVFLFGVLGTSVIFIVRKDPNKGIFRENFYSVLGWFVLSGIFYNWNLRKYKETINKIYKSLENEISVNVHLKNENNPNFFSSDEIDDFDD